jgi:glycerophosphoryl diester phosphodiesterase
LIQLIEADCDLEHVATYADGIGPWVKQIVSGKNHDGTLQLSNLVAQAHALGLAVHPYTFRADSLPAGITANQLLDTLFNQVEVDGIFSDCPDVSRHFIRTRTRRR